MFDGTVVFLRALASACGLSYRQVNVYGMIAWAILTLALIWKALL